MSTVDSQLQVYGKDLKKLDEQRKNKQEQNEIDDTASARIRKFIAKTQTEIDSLVKKNTILIGETVIERSDWEQLKKALIRSKIISRTIGDKVLLIADLISRNTVVKLDQDVLFEPGQYTVTKEVGDAVGKFFEPAVKEIGLFVKKYPDFPLSLVITAKGYADGTPISEGTTLYKELMDRLKLKSSPPDNKDLNKELSRARAEEVIALFKKYTTSSSGTGVDIRNILYLFEGKGDAFPNPKLNDYKTDDKRRRVVLLFWSIFPE